MDEIKELTDILKEKKQLLKTLQDNDQKFRCLKDLSEIKEPLNEWDDGVFRKLVECVEIGGKGDVKVRWKVW